jgi:hypothetical protein
VFNTNHVFILSHGVFPLHRLSQALFHLECCPPASGPTSALFLLRGLEAFTKAF